MSNRDLPLTLPASTKCELVMVMVVVVQQVAPISLVSLIHNTHTPRLSVHVCLCESGGLIASKYYTQQVISTSVVKWTVCKWMELCYGLSPLTLSSPFSLNPREAAS